MARLKRLQMEYLQKPEINALLKASHGYGNKEAHLALLTMYATGTRVSQALKLKGIDVMPDTVTAGHKVRIPQAKRGKTRSFRILVSPNPFLDMRELIDLAEVRGANALFGGLT